ncbi:hypothetical protein [Pectobacterium brasiliense]|uniref:hypothetical protein n=1 Tax=Pectobacterium brasiliense TaxID=180957 RepID=UPI0004E6F7A2|nr:hypothetical protein [Pectobacterium brasiliense]KFF71283.1 hypothetical protein IW00_01595 [Pectobacterium brasiliense]KHS80488.1 hypothetical protein RC81_08115 [Pectobacterium brasiliense]MBN3116800.1 hypothetical protein [Pectobacterium brasiliense]MDY4333367.1 hypothetical protein [Pectobacterium brasiliense]WJM83172.1 hypothetical protein QTI90_10695 [Pectobacterium brasiliense]
MQLSEYLKYKMESERVLATHLDSMADKIKDNTIKLSDDLYSGIERATWYSSCFIEKYNSDCQQLKSENERMYLAIKQIYKRRDVIFDILVEYIKILLKDTEEREQKLIAKAILGVSIASDMTTDRTIKMSVAYLLAKHIATSLNFSLSIRRSINKYSLIGLSALAFHGKVQKAAMSARHLHDVCPELYWSLYAMQVEMLYFVLEERLSPYVPKSSYDKIDITEAINGMLKK